MKKHFFKFLSSIYGISIVLMGGMGCWWGEGGTKHAPICA